VVGRLIAAFDCHVKVIAARGRRDSDWSSGHLPRYIQQVRNALVRAGVIGRWAVGSANGALGLIVVLTITDQPEGRFDEPVRPAAVQEDSLALDRPISVADDLIAGGQLPDCNTGPTSSAAG
jgi:hypothetical protein